MSRCGVCGSGFVWELRSWFPNRNLDGHVGCPFCHSRSGICIFALVEASLGIKLATGKIRATRFGCFRSPVTDDRRMCCICQFVVRTVIGKGYAGSVAVTAVSSRWNISCDSQMHEAEERFEVDSRLLHVWGDSRGGDGQGRREVMRRLTTSSECNSRIVFESKGLYNGKDAAS